MRLIRLRRKLNKIDYSEKNTDCLDSHREKK